MGKRCFLCSTNTRPAEKYGEKRVLIMDGEIQKALKLWLKKIPNSDKTLFMDLSKGEERHADSATITKILTTMSKREFEGKSVGSSLIRHMYLSSKYGETVKEMEKDADLMGHSSGVQQTIYVKED